MHGVLATEFAVLHELQSVGVIFLVFLRVVVSLFALGASQSNLDSCVIRHLAAPPIIIYLTSFGKTSVYLPLKGTEQTFRWRVAGFTLQK